MTYTIPLYIKQDTLYIFFNFIQLRGIGNLFWIISLKMSIQDK